MLVCAGLRVVWMYRCMGVLVVWFFVDCVGVQVYVYGIVMWVCRCMGSIDVWAYMLCEWYGCCVCVCVCVSLLV